MNDKNNFTNSSFDDFFGNLKKFRLLIAAVTLLFIIVSLLISLTLDNHYKSTALVSVVDNQSNNLPQISSGISSLASLAGLDMSSLSGGDKSSLAIATLMSKSFLERIINEDMFLQNIMAAENYNLEENIITYNSKIYNVDKNKWVRKVSPPFTEIPSVQEVYKEFHKNIFSVYEDPKTGYMILNVEHISPIFAKDLLNKIIDEINLYSREKELARVDKAISFLEKEYLNNNASIIDKSISTLIGSELQNKMIANISDEYMLEIIDEPFVPEYKSKPNRLLILLLAFLCGLSISLLYVFIFKRNE